MSSSRKEIFCVVGHPVSGSLSPAFQNILISEAGINAEYKAFDVAPDGFDRFLHSAPGRSIAGLNITAPLKKIAAAAADILSQEAAAAGVVNTLVMDHGSWIGYNTDGAGFIDAVKEAGWTDAVRGGAMVFLGSGGAVAGLISGVGGIGVRRAAVIARDVSSAAELAGSAGAGSAGEVEILPEPLEPDRLLEILPGAALLVNTIPSAAWSRPSMAPLLAAIRSALEEEESPVLDLNYTKFRGRTPFLDGIVPPGNRAGKPGRSSGGARNRNRGERLDGFSMLVYQGVRSLEIWTGRKFAGEGLAARLDAAIRG